GRHCPTRRSGERRAADPCGCPFVALAGGFPPQEAKLLGCPACRTRCPGRWPRQARRSIEQLGHIGPWFGAATAPSNRRLLAEGEQVRPRARPLGRAGVTYRG